jgi:hypothetical protein
MIEPLRVANLPPSNFGTFSILAMWWIPASE